MHFRITSDSNWETRVGDVTTKISGPIRISFEEKSYGSSVNGIVVVLMCRDPKLAFKQRIRFAKKEKILFVDVMLDYRSMLSANDDKTRFNMIKEDLTNVLFSVIRKYKFANFDTSAFAKDLETSFNQILC